MSSTETPEPWAPEGASRIGAPPTRDDEGERGTSAYDGDGPSDERGPLGGVDYYSETGRTQVGTGITEHQRESASG
jgi:hypothetical protein